MTCESFDATLDALLDGRCSHETWREAEAHLAACDRCRRIFDAMSGRADDLDDEAHDDLAAAILAKTGGERACASARERLCDYADRRLEDLDRDLVAGHLSRCQSCAALAAALEEIEAVLPSFATLAPRPAVFSAVVAATSRRVTTPTVAERFAAWLARAAERPRFPLEAAYVMTVLLLVILGNPVDAFREATVRVQPRVSAVAGSVGRPLAEMRTAGAERLSGMERFLPSNWPSSGAAARVGSGWRSVFDRLERIGASARSIVERVAEWMRPMWDACRRVFGLAPSEPSPEAARSSSRSGWSAGSGQQTRG